MKRILLFCMKLGCGLVCLDTATIPAMNEDAQIRETYSLWNAVLDGNTKKAKELAVKANVNVVIGYNSGESKWEIGHYGRLVKTFLHLAVEKKLLDLVDPLLVRMDEEHVNFKNSYGVAALDLAVGFIDLNKENDSLSMALLMKLVNCNKIAKREQRKVAEAKNLLIEAMKGRLDADSLFEKDELGRFISNSISFPYIVAGGFFYMKKTVNLGWFYESCRSMDDILPALKTASEMNCPVMRLYFIGVIKYLEAYHSPKSLSAMILDGQIEAAQILINDGVDINILDEGNTLLHLAVKKDLTDLIDPLLAKMRIDFINCRNSEGHTPLHIAVDRIKNGTYTSADILKKLLNCSNIVIRGAYDEGIFDCGKCHLSYALCEAQNLLRSAERVLIDESTQTIPELISSSSAQADRHEMVGIKHVD